MSARKFTLKVRRSPERFKVDYEKDLNEQQLAVVKAGEGPILVIAGAGSGKTRAITYRVAYLLECGVPAERILLVTFTNKAAREMLHRVEILVESETRRLWGGTFHHVANLILRRHAERLGYRTNFNILDREDSKSLIKTCRSELDLKGYPRRFPGGDVLEAIHTFSANTMRPLGEVVRERFPQFENEVPHIQTALKRYDERKRELHLMDYDDLLLNWRRLLLEHDEILKVWSEKFLYVLVDEYQDTNRIQGEIVDLLAGAHGNLTVVGDDAQSIYRFRGANFENIITFPERYPNAKVFRLETNYRSSPEILQLANSSIKHNIRQFPKTLAPVKKAGPKPALVPCRDTYQQADFIAQYVLQLLEEGRSLNDIAILYRSHWLSMELQLELTRRNIPFIVRGGPRFFEQAHIKDVVAHLRVVENPFDELGWFRVLTLLPKIGPTTAKKIWTYLHEKERPLEAIRTEECLALVPRGARSGFSDFLVLLAKLAAPGMEKAPSEMVAAVLETGYEDYLSSRYSNYHARGEDIRQLANFALQYNSLEKFLTELALLGEVSAEYITLGPTETEHVMLSTIHQAKGLEWPVVFIIGLADGRLPSQMALREPEGEEEERRIFYVGLTRAKDELYLSFPIHSRERGIGDFFMKRSRFVTELDREVYEIMELEELAGQGARGLDLTSGRFSLPSPGEKPAAGATERFRLERPHHERGEA